MQVRNIDFIKVTNFFQYIYEFSTDLNGPAFSLRKSEKY